MRSSDAVWNDQAIDPKKILMLPGLNLRRSGARGEDSQSRGKERSFGNFGGNFDTLQGEISLNLNTFKYILSLRFNHHCGY